LLGEHQSIIFKNAVRAAILTYCVDRGTDPASLSKDPHEAEIKNLLGNYGWSEKSYPAGLDIQNYFMEAKKDGFLGTWIADAGNMRSDLTKIEGQIEKALTSLKESLLLLNSEIAKATTEHARGMREEGKSMAREGSSLLASAKLHAENLVGGGELANAELMALKPLQELSKRLQAAHPDKAVAILEWEQNAINKIDSASEWESVSNSVGSDLHSLHHTLLDCKPETRPAFFDALVASRALEFDRAGIQEIRELHGKTAGKVEAEIAKIENLRARFALLSVQTALPAEIVSDSQGTPRTWVGNFFDKNKATISSNKDFGNSQDAKDLAAHFNKMAPLEFLGLFKQGGELHTFFSNGAKKNPKDFGNLVAQMDKLRSGLEGMEEKLSSYERGAFEGFRDDSKFAPPQKDIAGNADLRSIGNILKKSGLPPGIQALEGLVEGTKVALKSESKYHEAVQKLGEDLIEKKAAQRDEDLESLNENLSEYGGQDGEFEWDEQENGVGMGDSGQAGLMQFAMQESFSNRRSQQIEQLAQNLPPGIPN
jgi:hypothetical protein